MMARLPQLSRMCHQQHLLEPMEPYPLLIRLLATNRIPSALPVRRVRQTSRPAAQGEALKVAAQVEALKDKNRIRKREKPRKIEPSVTLRKNARLTELKPCSVGDLAHWWTASLETARLKDIMKPEAADVEVVAKANSAPLS